MKIALKYPKHPGRLAGICVLLVLLSAGGALVGSGVTRRSAERRAAATALAAGAAERIAQRLDRAREIVEARTLELSIRRTVDQGEDTATPFFVEAVDPAYKEDGGRQPGDRHPGREWAADLAPPRDVFRLATELLGPRRDTDGRWVALVRAPLVVASRTGSLRFTAWVAARLPLDALVPIVDQKSFLDAGFDYEIACLLPSSTHPRVITRSSEVDLPTPIVQIVHATGNRWTIALAPRGGWIRWPLVIGEGLLVCAFALFGALATVDLIRRPRRLYAEVDSRDRRLQALHLRLGHEIEQREALATQFSHANFHDPLTGIANRRYFMDRLQRGLQRARQRPTDVLAVIVVNFDRLKNLTDSLGPSAVDQMLVHAVLLFKSAMDPHDHVIARLADDEFGVLLFNTGSGQAARNAAERLQATLADPFTVGSQSLFVTASMGIALCVSGYEGADELVRGAHIASFKAPSEGMSRIALFDPATRDQIVTRQQLETDLHLAIERDEFCLNFQPIVSLDTGRLAGMEVLVRWKHPLDGTIPPDRFIPLAEETGLIVHITRWVLREACRQASVWRALLPTADFYLTVNLSAHDLRQPDLSTTVTDAVLEAGLPPGMLRLELTESMMIDNVDAVSELVQRLRILQVPLLLDDFGTGYSSLSYLNRFKFDYIKIDRSFIMRMNEGDQNAGIVRAIVHLAHDLGIKTVAEGVETAAHSRALKALGCDYGQGYLFARPVDAEQAQQLLLSGKTWAEAALEKIG